MYRIEYYKDRRGKEPVKDYIDKLAVKGDKNSRIQFTKIMEYIDQLSAHGLQLREPFVKHLRGEIWELRPLRDRILFVAWDGEGFMLLHHFMKRTQKTPRKEIDTAQRRYDDALQQKGERIGAEREKGDAGNGRE